MNKLPKNINTVGLLKEYWHTHNYFYTIDDFIEDYRISERTAKDLLKDVDHISITQSLYTKLKDVNRKKFYNKMELFKSLVMQGKISYTYNYMATLKDENGEFYHRDNTVTKEKIKAETVFKFIEFFEDITRISSSTSEVNKAFNDNHPSAKRRTDKQVQTMEGIEINIGKGIRRFHSFLIGFSQLDNIIAYILGLEVLGYNE